MAILKVYDGSLWVPAVAKVWDGSVWQPKMKFHDGTDWEALYSEGSVVMTAEGVSHFNPGVGCHAGIVFNSDGSISALGPTLATLTLVNAGEWWSEEPETGIGAGYDVRCLSAGATGTWSSAAAADDTWIQISSNRKWRVAVSKASSPNSKGAIRTFEIRLTGSGSGLASALYSCTAEN